MALVHKARRPGRSALTLVVVLVVGVVAGVATIAYQRPAESYSAIEHLLSGDPRAGAEPGDGPGRTAAVSSDTEIDAVKVAGAMAGATARPAAEPLYERKVAPAPPPEPVEGSGLVGKDIEVPDNPSGRLRVAEGRERAPGDGTVYRVRVAVERGLPVDRAVFADAVLTTLNDPRGWSSVDRVTFARTDGDDHDFEVVLAGPDTTDELCAPLDTGGSLSCGVVGMAVLNFKRWAFGSNAWGNTDRYRQYLVNHEVGHVIGHAHELCAGKGKKATVMVQQTRSTQGCVPEPWPAPGRG